MEYNHNGRVQCPIENCNQHFGSSKHLSVHLKNTSDPQHQLVRLSTSRKGKRGQRPPLPVGLYQLIICHCGMDFWATKSSKGNTKAMWNRHRKTMSPDSNHSIVLEEDVAIKEGDNRDEIANQRKASLNGKDKLDNRLGGNGGALVKEGGCSGRGGVDTNLRVCVRVEGERLGYGSTEVERRDIQQGLQGTRVVSSRDSSPFKRIPIESLINYPPT